jgi:hypothetical protein
MGTEPAGSCLMGVPFARVFSLAVELMECRTRKELWCAAIRLPHPPPVSEGYWGSMNVFCQANFPAFTVIASRKLPWGIPGFYRRYLTHRL